MGPPPSYYFGQTYPSFQEVTYNLHRGFSQFHIFTRLANPFSWKSKVVKFFLKGQQRSMMRRDREVVDFTRSRVKNNTKFINLMKMPRIEGYNGK